ncbi:hypothetical protein RHMOL_Rhmol08G0197800 [Rhododendron molle]|uniref:Uncharacterized protein n=1 Tax=Rhododendron molle TaxID=49168 RepID=A0ACC0MQK0_RHOML|nr:hypothetical protein RHMOL_Rhmol08G0197800 [Rhododendron molle]
MVGEIGGNNYNYAFLLGKSIDKVKSMVPEVVGAIPDAVRQVIGYGAARVVVPGNFPIGCFPIYLTAFQSNNPNDYDEHHCLKELNSISNYHNDKLQEAIQQLQREYLNTVIVYGKMYRLPFSGANAPLALVHSDVWGLALLPPLMDTNTMFLSRISLAGSLELSKKWLWRSSSVEWKSLPVLALATIVNDSQVVAARAVVGVVLSEGEDLALLDVVDLSR